MQCFLNHQRIDLEWKMDDMEYEELFDVKLSLEEKAEKFSIDIVCDPLDMRIEFTSKENDNSVRVFVSEYFMENESDFNLAIRLGFPKEEVEFSEKDLINYLNEMIAYHSKFI